MVFDFYAHQKSWENLQLIKQDLLKKSRSYIFNKNSYWKSLKYIS